MKPTFVKEQLRLEKDPWIIVRHRAAWNEAHDSLLTLGFSRYEKPELRIHISSHLLQEGICMLHYLAIDHMRDTLSEGELISTEMEHPSGEGWRLLARKCRKTELLVVYDTVIDTYARLGAPQTTNEFYRNGIIDIILSDENNLLPGESGYNSKLDVPVETITLQ